MRTIHYEFDVTTVDLIIEGLAKLPYERSAGVIHQIQAHARTTLNPPPPEPADQTSVEDEG